LAAVGAPFFLFCLVNFTFAPLGVFYFSI